MDVKHAKLEQRRGGAQMAQFFEDFDIMPTATTAVTAFDMAMTILMAACVPTCSGPARSTPPTLRASPDSVFLAACTSSGHATTMRSSCAQHAPAKPGFRTSVARRSPDRCHFDGLLM
ncbi:MAG: hypothetical protein GDA49_05685 [Rhodospirillales bacterium]|nr:hypothetical protein [Rhodospirillales bacterium]